VALSTIRLKRAYDDPEPDDGRRYLVDALWPRGRTKDELKLDGWLKEVAPSNDLRRWFHANPDQWLEFRKRYFRELDDKPDAWTPLLHAAERGRVTLVYSARNTEQNNATALVEYLREHPKKQ
jgi:uncharacterized protein YeaO (DUF488 family)